MVELLLAKEMTRVRFPLAAQMIKSRGMLQGIIFGSAVVLTVLIVKENIIVGKTVAEVIDGTTSNAEAFEYRNEVSGYALSVPGGWGAEDNSTDPNFESRAVFKPGENSLKIKEITVSVVTDPAASQPFSKPEELDKWYGFVNGTTLGGATKVDNTMTAGEKTVMVTATDATTGEWTVMGWFRKSNKNYYVNMTGRDEFSDDDRDVFKLLLSTFRWI